MGKTKENGFNKRVRRTLEAIVIIIILLLLLGGVSLKLRVKKEGITGVGATAGQETEEQIDTGKTDSNTNSEIVEDGDEEDKMPTLKELADALEKNAEKASLPKADNQSPPDAPFAKMCGGGVQ